MRATDRVEPVKGVWEEVYPERYHPETVREIIREEIDLAIHAPELDDKIIGGSISYSALKRGHTHILYSPAAGGNYTISATTMTAIDSANLSGTVRVNASWVKLEARLRGVQAGAAGSLVLGFSWDGDWTEDDGSWTWGSTSATGASFFTVVKGVEPGVHRFDLGAYRVTSDALIYSGAGNSIEILVTEI